MDGPKENLWRKIILLETYSLLDHPYVDYARYKRFLAFCNERIKDLEEFKKDNQLDSSNQVEKMSVQQEYHVDEGAEGFEEDSNQVGAKDKKKKTDCLNMIRKCSIHNDLSSLSLLTIKIDNILTRIHQGNVCASDAREADVACPPTRQVPTRQSDQATCQGKDLSMELLKKLPTRQVPIRRVEQNLDISYSLLSLWAIVVNGVRDALLDSKRERILVLLSPFVLYAYHLKYKTWECIADKFATWYQYSAVVDEHDILCCIGPAMNRDEFPMDDEWEIPFNLHAFDLVTKKWLPVEWTDPCNLRASTSGSYLLYIGNGDLCLATPWELVQYRKRVSTRYFTRIWLVTFSMHKTTNGDIIAKEKYSSSVKIPGNEHGIIVVPLAEAGNRYGICNRIFSTQLFCQLKCQVSKIAPLAESLAPGSLAGCSNSSACCLRPYKLVQIDPMSVEQKLRREYRTAAGIQLDEHQEFNNKQPVD
ncbi:hypothetical protein Dimus_006905 [Dionaea muscipula]